MRVSMHSQFLDALSVLSRTEQRQARQMLNQVLSTPELSGLRTHKVGRFVSLSASMSIRALAATRGDTLTFVYVGQHDEVYRWGERHSPLFSSEGVLLALLAAPVEESSIKASGGGIITEAQLVSSGLPSELAKYLAQFGTESELLNQAQYLAPELQEAVLGALVNEQSKLPSVSYPSDIFVLNGDEFVQYALDFPSEKWRIFLHPQQRFIVEMPIDRNILIKGGPGTGKTVALLHRFARLLQLNNARPPVFLMPNRGTRAVVSKMLGRLMGRDCDQFLLMMSDLPKGASNLKAELGKYSSVFVDEGQDLGAPFLSNFLPLLEAGAAMPALCVGYDGNQSVHAASLYAIQRLSSFADAICLVYNYRSTRQIAAMCSGIVEHLHRTVRGKDFKAQHEIDSSRDLQTSKTRTALSGPEVVRVLASDVVDAHEKITTFIDLCHKVYGACDEIAVVIVGKERDSIAFTRLRGLIENEVTVLEPIEAKGQEVFGGCVVELGFGLRDPKTESATPALYREMSGVYVACSRFRDRVLYIEVK